ncbi:beta-carotene 15,15'-dioxygenase, Brp/Blh family [Aquipuribacter sp. MA13-6]|uniref:beta-carotene 15,15'-dioxygenase, Brp/Blh family n=1 Tax=unclassified Aquipuribacter TaxID=2635084 RepID=UPI003EEE40BB
MPLVAHDRITRTGTVAVVVGIAVSVLLAPFGEPWRTGVAGAVAVLLIALGSPHGALDHLVLLAGRPDAPDARDRHDRGATRGGRLAGRLDRLRGAPVVASFRGLSTRFVTGYVTLALLSLTAYLMAPRAGFALFLVLSVAHFATGEAGVAVERGLARGWTDPLAWVASLGGAVVVVLPLASREAGAALTAVDPRLAPVLGPLPLLADVLVVVGVTAVLWCVAASVRGDHRAATVATELAALTALAALAHPLIAFAVFFAFWHALRHQSRLAQVLRGPTGAPSARHVDRPLREVLDSAWAGVPATVGVLVVAVALGLTGATVLGGLLAVIWALTVPHSVAVAVLEVRAARARKVPTEPVPAPGTAAGPATSNDHDEIPAGDGDGRRAAAADGVRG